MKELVCHWGQLESMGSTIVRSTKVTSPSLATKTTVLVLSRWRNNWALNASSRHLSEHSGSHGNMLWCMLML